MAVTSSGLVHPYFDVGDVAPAVVLLDPDGKTVPISRLAGRPSVLHLISPGDDKSDETKSLIQGFDAFAKDLPAPEGEVLLVRQVAPFLNLAITKKFDLSCRVLSDEKGEFAHNLNLTEKSATVIFDHGSHLRAVIPVADANTHIEIVKERLREVCPVETYRAAGDQAPVLSVPGVFSPDYCRFLIELYHSEGNIESGFMETTKNGTELKNDPNVKRRRDHVIRHGHPLELEVRHLFDRRINPEIERNTYYRVQNHEEFKVVRYSEEEQGFFKAHRDNNSTEAGGRRFAVSVLLNDPAEYDGGALVFPEYGQIGYRPGAGAAAIFACGLLHEVRPVTRGERYVLLAFLH